MNLHPLSFVAVSMFVSACVGSPTGPVPRTAHPIATVNKRALNDILHRVEASVSTVAAPAASLRFRTVAVVSATTSPSLALINTADGSTLWKRPFPGTLRPVIAGDLVLTSHDTTLSAFQSKDGALRFQSALPPGKTIGIARSANHIFLVTQRHAELATLSAFDAHNGALEFQKSIAGQAGAPTAAGNLLLVPVQGQSLRAFDSDTGNAIGQVDTSDDVWAFVRISGGRIWVGDKQTYILTRGYDGTSKSTLLQPNSLSDELPGRPSAFPPSFIPAPSTPSAHGRISLHDDPTTRHPYFTFFKHIYAFAPNGELLWAQNLDADIARSTSTPRGIAIVTVDGQVLYLHAKTGTVGHLANLGYPVASAAFSAHSRFAQPAKTPPRTPLPRAPQASSPSALREALKTIVMDRDARLLPSRLMALRALAKLPEAEATRDLLDIIQTGANFPSKLAKEAADALGTRTLGHGYILQALSTRYDRLTYQPTPPLWALAPAASALELVAAVPLLEQHLFDHETAATDLMPIVHAMGHLAPDAAHAALSRLLSRHRTDTALLDSPAILRELAQTLAQTGSPAALASLTKWSLHPSTAANKAVVFANAVKTMKRKKSARLPGTATPPLDSQEETVPPPPGRLQPQTIARAFAPYRTSMASCVDAYQDKKPTFRRVRIITQIDASGLPLARHYLPHDAALSACLNDALLKQTFGESRLSRQLVTFSAVATADNAPDPEGMRFEPDDSATAEPWWAWHLTRETSSETSLPAPSTVPWWRDQNPMTISVEQSPTRPAVQAPSVPPSKSTPGSPVAPRKTDALVTPEDPAATPWWTPAQ